MPKTEDADVSEGGEDPEAGSSLLMLARVPEERRTEPDPDDRKRQQPLPRTIKGMADDRWNAIMRAAKGRHETVAEYIWHSHEVRAGADQPRAAEGVPALITEDEPLRRPASLSLVDLFDVICKFASVEAAPGNRALLTEARAVLCARLREAREGTYRPPPAALPESQ